MPRRGWVLPFLAVALVGGTIASGAGASADVAGHPGIRLVSHDATGGYPDTTSYAHRLTDDGRFLLFDSSSDLTGDGRRGDIFLADVATGTVERGPVRAGGTVVAITPDGRFVVAREIDAFGNGYYERVDRTDGTRGTFGGRGGILDISEDGNVVLSEATVSDPFGSSYRHLYASDLRTNQTVAVDGVADGHTGYEALLSRDGRAVLFSSDDPALDPGVSSGRPGVFRRWLDSGALDLLSAGDDGGYAAPLFVSRDGTVVALMQGPVQRLVTPAGSQDLAGYAAGLSIDGRYVLVDEPGPGGSARQLYRYDVADGSRVLASATTAGDPVTGHFVGYDLSGDGSTVAFVSTGDGIVPGTAHGIHLYRRSIDAGTTELVCCNISSSFRTAHLPFLSEHGDRIVFQSGQQLEPADTGSSWDLFAAGDYPPLPATTTTTTSTTLPPPVVSVADTHVAEDAGRPMTWTLSLDRPAAGPVTVRWWTFQDTSAPSDRRAAPDKDFKPAAGSVTFAPGEMTKTVSSLVFDDSFFERDEWFVVELFDPTGATIGRPKATGTINDDESARFWAIPRQLARLLPA